MELDAKIKVELDPNEVFDNMSPADKRDIANKHIDYADVGKVLDHLTKAILFDEVAEAYLYKSTNTHIEVCEWLERHAGELGYVKKDN